MKESSSSISPMDEKPDLPVLPTLNLANGRRMS